MRAVRVVVLLPALLAACAQVEIKPPEGPLEFSLAGRIAARYGGESFTGNIAWRHARGGDELLISTPTGQGVAQIVRQGEAVLLKTAEPREYRDNDAEALTERVLGFRIPIDGLATTSTRVSRIPASGASSALVPSVDRRVVGGRTGDRGTVGRDRNRVGATAAERRDVGDTLGPERSGCTADGDRPNSNRGRRRRRVGARRRRSRRGARRCGRPRSRRGR